MHVHLAKGQGGLRMNSIVKTEQIRAIQTSRFQEYYGRLDSQAIKKIEEAVKITLAL
jgi:mRNA-degrading endonuclease toxin of MazEF toxin-antitoxin module